MRDINFMYRGNLLVSSVSGVKGGEIYTPLMRGQFCEEASIVYKTVVDASEDAHEMTDRLSRTSHVPLDSL